MQKNKRYYWLGHDTAGEQDRFFIDALDKNLWTQGNKDQWDTCWYTGMPDNDVFEQLEPHQSINHIPGNNSITIKSNLYDTLMAAKSRLTGTKEARRFDFFPETFSMPEDYFQFQQTALAEPEQLWIKKPKNLSRGRGIDMVRHHATVPFDSEWIIQRYLSNPHLCQGRKYVLRCYVLVTSVEPLRFYWYQDGFAKLASETYSVDDLDNLYRHLTNPDINEKNDAAESAITFISFQKYREWLNSEGHDDKVFFTQLKELITLTVIAAREAMRKRTKRLTENSTGCYELIGLDCMVDDNIKPWIIECNLSPSLSTYADPDAGADDEVVAKREMVKDLVQLLGLNNPSSVKLTHSEKARQEQQQCGNFERLFPTDKANHYFPLFPIPRHADISHAPIAINSQQLQLTPHQSSDYAFSDSVTIFSSDNHAQNTHCISPNDIAAWIWLKNSEGALPEAIIDELSQTLPCPDETDYTAFQQEMATQVWDVLADWSHANVFTAHAPTNNISNTAHTTRKKPILAGIKIGQQDVSLYLYCDNAVNYLESFYTLQTTHINTDISIDVIPTHYGYTLVHNKINIINGCKLSELLPTIYRLSIKQLSDTTKQYFLPATYINIENKNILIFSHHYSLFDQLSHQLLINKKTCILQNYFLLSAEQTQKNLHPMLTPLCIPIKLPTTIKPDTGPSLISENNQGSFRYFQPPQEHHSITSVDTIVFLSDHKEDTISQTISKADALKRISMGSYPREHSTLIDLAEWVESVSEIHHLETKDTSSAYKQLLKILEP
jgi:tubulin polyglutamylase TTLL5